MFSPALRLARRVWGRGAAFENASQQCSQIQSRGSELDGADRGFCGFLLFAEREQGFRVNMMLVGIVIRQCGCLPGVVETLRCCSHL